MKKIKNEEKFNVFDYGLNRENLSQIWSKFLIFRMYRHLRNGQKSLRLLRQNELTRQTRFSSNRQVQRIFVLELNFQSIYYL